MAMIKMCNTTNNGSDLFPGETVCFPCPACTKSHIVPLPISHADSPLQVLGYLADGGSDFRISFFLTGSQEYGIPFSTSPPNLNMVLFNTLVLRLNSSQLIACDSLLCSPLPREERILLRLRLYHLAVYTLCGESLAGLS